MCYQQRRSYDFRHKLSSCFYSNRKFLIWKDCVLIISVFQCQTYSRYLRRRMLGNHFPIFTGVKNDLSPTRPQERFPGHWASTAHVALMNHVISVKPRVGVELEWLGHDHC